MLGSESELFSKFVEKSLLNLFLSQKNNRIYQFIEKTNSVVTKVNREIAQDKCYYVVNTQCIFQVLEVMFEILKTSN